MVYIFFFVSKTKFLDLISLVLCFFFLFFYKTIKKQYKNFTTFFFFALGHIFCCSNLFFLQKKWALFFATETTESSSNQQSNDLCNEPRTNTESNQRKGPKEQKTTVRELTEDQHSIKQKSKKIETSSRESEKSEPIEIYDVTFLNSPGIYEILDIKNNKSYYGETSLLSRRCMHHYQGLINDHHECKSLLAAFRKIKDIQNFRFLIHKSGPEWAEKQARVAYETFLIKQNKHRCYNDTLKTEEKNFPMTRKPLMYNNTRYESTRAAAKALNRARATVLRHIESNKYQNVYYIEEHSYGFIPIFAKSERGWSVLFSSMGDCVKAQYATNVQNARRKIKRGQDGWRYAHLNAETNKPLRVLCVLKPDRRMVIFPIL